MARIQSGNRMSDESVDSNPGVGPVFLLFRARDGLHLFLLFIFFLLTGIKLQ